MSFSTYTNLQDNIAAWLARDDLTAYIPDMIRLFECTAARRLRVRLQEATATLTPSGGVATIPSDYLGYRRVTWTGSPIHGLDYVAPPLYAAYLESGSGTPTVFTIEGSNLRVAPSNDTALTFDYIQRTVAVESSLNWLYTTHPDVYLFGSLVEANAFNKGKGFESAAVWKSRRDEVFSEITSLNFNELQGLAIRTLGLTP